jgi:hypothetical protein
MTNRLRQWSQKSYSSTDGRAASSLGDENLKGSPSTTHAENVNAQIPTAFDHIDKRRTQGKEPVSRRPFTQKHE